MRRFPLLPIFLVVLVDVFGLALVIPILPLYVVEQFGGNALQATLLMTTYAACQFCSAPILGTLSDRYGRKPVLLLSQMGTLTAWLLMASAGHLWVLYVARAIDGFTAGNLSTAQAYISDNTLPENRAKSFGLIGISFGLGFLGGPLITVMLAKYAMSASFYVAAGLSFTSILCTTFLLPGGGAARARAAAQADEPAGRRPSPFALKTYATYLTRPVLGGLYVQFFCFIFAFSTFNAGFTLFCQRRFSWHGHMFDRPQIGAVLAYVAILGITIQGGLLGRFVKRFGEPALVTTAFLLMAIGYLALGQIQDSVPQIAFAATFASLGNAFLRPNLSTLITLVADRKEQGVAIGMSQSIGSIAQIVAPALAGLLILTGHLTAWATVAGGAAALGLFLAKWGSARVPRRAPKAEMVGT